MKSAALQRVVQGDRDRVDWRSLVPQPDVAALLTDHPVTEVFQCANYTVCGYAARQLHAASTEINSSFT
jgi:hypothetical protein